MRSIDEDEGQWRTRLASLTRCSTTCQSAFAAGPCIGSFTAPLASSSHPGETCSTALPPPKGRQKNSPPKRFIWPGSPGGGFDDQGASTNGRTHRPEGKRNSARVKRPPV